MATKYKMFYGQYDSPVAKQLSIDNLGAVVYSGKTCEIYVDGKCIAANFSQSVEDLKNYIDTQINNILGASDLEETLDTIKEIQDELLKEISYTIKHTVGSDVEIINVVKVVDESEDTVYYVNTENNETVATEVEDGSDGIEYEEGYSDLEKENAIDALLRLINENKSNIENIENKKLVANILVSDNANENKNFVETTSEENEADEYGLKTQTYTIGVKYGTFKTGHGNVLDPESNAYTDGIATVENVQNYIEERMVWDEFVQDTQTIIDDANTNENADYDVPNSSEVDNPMIIG